VTWAKSISTSDTSQTRLKLTGAAELATEYLWVMDTRTLSYRSPLHMPKLGPCPPPSPVPARSAAPVALKERDGAILPRGCSVPLGAILWLMRMAHFAGLGTVAVTTPLSCILAATALTSRGSRARPVRNGYRSALPAYNTVALAIWPDRRGSWCWRALPP
jgi:hypothetical protein